jgi:hypothetical protein
LLDPVAIERADPACRNILFGNRYHLAQLH